MEIHEEDVCVRIVINFNLIVELKSRRDIKHSLRVALFFDLLDKSDSKTAAQNQNVYQKLLYKFYLITYFRMRDFIKFYQTYFF